MNNKINLVKIDQSRFCDAIKAYFLWKELNVIIKTSHTRGINFPEAISETLLCYVCGFELNKASAGDVYDVVNGQIIEVKATSNFDGDVSSFSPKENFDNLFFVRLDQRNDVLYFYNIRISSEQLKLVKVNAKETLAIQQAQGRRPRLSIIKTFIEKNDLKPCKTLDLRTKEIK